MLYSKSTGGFYDAAINSSIPADAVEISDADYSALLAGQSAGKIISADSSGSPVLVDPPAPTFQQQVEANTAAIQAEMDRQAKAKGYDSIMSACSYAAQAAGAPFQAEGAAFLDWRSKVWQQAYATLSAVEAGTATMPTPAQAVADMPTLVLPQ